MANDLENLICDILKRNILITISELEEYNPTEKGDAIIIREIPNDVYHSDVGISSSFVRQFADSQVHAIEVEQETTPAMNFGTAAHYMLVEG